MTEPGSAFITRVRMAESGSPRRSSDSDDEYDLTLSSSLSSEVSEEVRLSWPSLEMEVLPSVIASSQVYPVPISMIGLTLLPFRLKWKLCTLIVWEIQTGKLVYECYTTAFIGYDR